MLAYHIPWVSAPGVPLDALPGLPVAGQKDSSGDADRLLAEVARYEGATYVGSSALLSLAGPLGATGAILAVANVEPELCCQAFSGDAAAQLKLTDVHLTARARRSAGAQGCPGTAAARGYPEPEHLTLSPRPARPGRSGLVRSGLGPAGDRPGYARWRPVTQS